MELLQIQDVDIELFYSLCANETKSFFYVPFYKSLTKEKIMASLSWKPPSCPKCLV